MPKGIALLFLFASAFLFRVNNSANVLCMFTSSAKTQLAVFIAVANTLIDRDHNVTVITTIPISPQLKSEKPFRHILLESAKETKIKLSAQVSEFGTGIFSETLGKFKYVAIANKFPSAQRDALAQVEFRKFLQEDNHFDLMLLGYFNNDFLVGVAAHFRCPIAVISLGQPFGPIGRMIGNPDLTSFVPIPLFGRNQPMTFSERSLNLLWAVVEPLIQVYTNWIMEGYYKSLFPGELYPKYSDVIRNVSLVLCNSHFSEMPIRPLVPALVEIGGIQVKEKRDPLPEDIQAFLDSSESGAILFNVGSKLRATYLTPAELMIVLKVLSKLDQKILWEWEEVEEPPTVSNILFRRSLPIDDILFHRNLKLFITDGRNSVAVSAAIRGVPMLGIPLYADEPYNVADMTYREYGLSVDINTLTEASLMDGITKVLYSPHYSQKVKYFSDLYRDRPMTARETAAFWLEYVIRYRGALHLQSPLVHMDMIQLWNIDVILALVGLLYVFKKSTKLVVILMKICVNFFSKMLRRPEKYKQI